MLRRITTVAAAAALSAAIAGCGTTSSGGAGTPSAGKSQTLNIVSVGYTPYFGDAVPAVKARLAEANANNEVPGYKFNYMGMINDQFTPDGAVAAYRQAKEQDNVFAVVGGASNSYPTAYVNQQQLPVVGYGQADSFCTHGSTQTWYFISTVGCVVPATAVYSINLGQPAKALEGGSVAGKTVACIGEDYPNAVNHMKQLCSSFKGAGFKVALTDASIPAPPAVVSDFSPWVQKLMTANSGNPVDVVVLGTSPGSSAGIAKGLNRSGFTGKIIGGAGFSPATTAAEKGVTEWSNIASPMSAANNPQMKKIVAALVAAGVKQSAISGTSVQAWLQADMFVKIAAATAAHGKLTSQAFAETAKSFTYEVPGVVGPTVYPAAFIAPTPCSEMDTSNGTVWTVTRPYTCDSLFSLSQGFVGYSSANPNQKY